MSKSALDPIAERVPITDIRITTNWRRFSTGLWRIPEGDIAAAYSAETMPKVRVFNHNGRLYANGGCCFSRWIHAEIDAYQLIPPDDYRGAESVPYSYEGRAVYYSGNKFRLGAKVAFAASDPTVAEWRDLGRVFYADGGYFASDCTYAEFIERRFNPQSENGRKATSEELGECATRQMPRTQEEMVALLGEIVPAGEPPKQYDFAL